MYPGKAILFFQNSVNGTPKLENWFHSPPAVERTDTPSFFLRLNYAPTPHSSPIHSLPN